MTYPPATVITMTINGTNVEDYILTAEGREILIESVLTSQVDTASFQLESPPIVPANWQEIIIQNDGTTIFGGYITRVEADPVRKGGTGITYTIDAADYSIKLAKTYVKAEYENKTDAYIINDLFTTYLPEIETATYLSTIKTFERVRFNRISLENVLIKICELSCADYYVDYDKKLHFFATSADAAPFGISDAPDYSTTYPYSNFLMAADGSGVVNVVEVVGGAYVGDDETFYLPGTGEDTKIKLPFRIRAPIGETSIQVWRNDGTVAVPVWTALDVLAGYINTLTDNTKVLYYYQESVLEGYDNWPNLENAVKVTARREIPLRTRVRNQASYDLYGHWLQEIISDSSIVTKAEAKTLGRAKLTENAFAYPAMTCAIYQSGLRSGMMLPVTNDKLNIVDEYIIQRATMHIPDSKIMTTDLELGAYDADLIDMIRSLARKFSDTELWRDDEVLDEILDVSMEILLSDYAAHISISQSAGPYLWDDCNWNFGVWS